MNVSRLRPGPRVVRPWALFQAANPPSRTSTLRPGFSARAAAAASTASLPRPSPQTTTCPSGGRFLSGQSAGRNVDGAGNMLLGEGQRAADINHRDFAPASHLFAQAGHGQPANRQRGQRQQGRHSNQNEQGASHKGSG